MYYDAFSLFHNAFLADTDVKHMKKKNQQKQINIGDIVKWYNYDFAYHNFGLES